MEVALDSSQPRCRKSCNCIFPAYHDQQFSWPTGNTLEWLGGMRV